MEIIPLRRHDVTTSDPGESRRPARRSVRGTARSDDQRNLLRSLATRRLDDDGDEADDAAGADGANCA